MKNYSNRFIKDSLDDDNYEFVTYVGRYGEDLMISKREDGTYHFSSFVLNLYDIYLPEESKTRIINAYCLKGNSDFNKDFDSPSFSHRLCELGNIMESLYKEYVRTKNFECFKLVKQIIKDVEIFKLNKTRYIDHFITYGSYEHWDYINYILDLRKRIIKTRQYRFELYAEFKRPIDNRSGKKFVIVAKTKRKAKKLFWKEHKKECKRIELFKKEEAVYGDESIQS